MNLSDKQIKIVDAIIRGNMDGTWLDLDQLKDKLDYAPTKDALQFSIRYLINKGIIEKKDLEVRRGQPRRILAPTPKAYELRVRW